MTTLNEAQLENIAIEYFQDLGYSYIKGTDIAPGGCVAERGDFTEVVLIHRLRNALARINPSIPESAREDALRQVLRIDGPSLIERNRTFHRLLCEGVDVTWRENGQEKHNKVWLVARDAVNVRANEFLIVNQFTIQGVKRKRRPDLLVFLNGLPIAVIELKNPADTNTTVVEAYNQLQNYKTDIPELFVYADILGISDGFDAKMGMLTSGYDRFHPWRTEDGQNIAPTTSPMLSVLIKGLFHPDRLVDYLLNFITFEESDAKIIKKGAAYHQFWAVQKAVRSTVDAASDQGDGRIGVIWHTQGSGKSLSMVFYARKIIQHAAMANPTLVIITDRNDLDDQLFQTFAINSDLLRQRPQQAASIEHLRSLLRVASGGVICTTIQKFDEGGALSDRRNIVVIADEAHRSQYGFGARIDDKGRLKYGLAKYLRDALPNASFIGFTGTPIELEDRSTRDVFGNYIDTYDIFRAVEDGATVPIYYESRLAVINLDKEEHNLIDEGFDKATESADEDIRKKLKSKWSALEAMVGSPERLTLVATDLVHHFEKRQNAMPGKGMIVAMSRRIAVEMYDAIVHLRPDWADDDNAKGKIKVVMSGSAQDPESWAKHIRTKAEQEILAQRFKNVDDELQLVIVCDMWLTGFDCPSMHTMYIDKPMGGHNLMQAIARVNRVFKDKPGGLVVDYVGIAQALRKATRTYTVSGGRGKTTELLEQAIALMQEKREVLRQMFHGFDVEGITQLTPAERLHAILKAMDFILQLDDGKRRFLDAVSALSKAYALTSTSQEAKELSPLIAVYQEIRAALVKTTMTDTERPIEMVDTAIRQLVEQSLSSDKIVDVFEAAGLEKPDISILSDSFLQSVRDMPLKNLAVEALVKLLKDEIRKYAENNVVTSRKFSEMLDEAVKKYTNRSIEAAAVIEHLIGLAKDIRASIEGGRGAELNLTNDELAFYDALADNESAKEVMGDAQLSIIARELTQRVRQSTSLDWKVQEDARARIRVMVKQILRKYGYPPDLQAKATELVVEQAERVCGQVA